MPDLETGTPSEPADDIRSALVSALAESEAPDVVETPEVSETSEVDDKPDRARGPDGKFAKKEDEPEPVVAAEKPEEQTEQSKVETKEAPTHWSQADKDKFKTQPPEVQSFILDRFKAMEGDYTKKTQAIAELKKEYGPVDEMFAPHKEVLRQKGFTPRSLIEAWANVEQKLAGGPDSAVDVIRGLVSGYNIPPEKIAAALGIARQAVQNNVQQQPTAVQNGQVVPLPPEVQKTIDDLRNKVGTFEQKFGTIEQREAQAAAAAKLADEQRAEGIVTEFKEAKDAKGNRLHEHFEEVEGLMTELAQAKIASKQPVPPLKDLYEMAVYAHPDVRQKVLTAQRQQEEKKRADEARAKAVAAKKAGSSVTGAPGTGQAPTGKDTGQSIRDSLEAAFEDVA
jgi:hypothetical protein